MKKLLLSICISLGLALSLAAQSVADYQKYHQQGRAELQAENYQAAISSLDQAIATMPYYSMLYHDRGVAKLQTGNYQGAAADFSTALAKKPYSIPSYLNRAIAYYELQNYEGAAEDLQKVLEFAPYDPEAQKYLSLVEQAQVEIQEAQAREAQAQLALQQQERDWIRQQRRQRRNQIVWGTIVPTALWTTAFLIWL